MKLRAVVECTYEADPEDYGTEDPREAAKIDEENGVDTVYLLAEESGFDLKVTPA